MKEQLEAIAASVPAIAADFDASEAAHASAVAAGAALLGRVVSLVRPVIRALGTRAEITRRKGSGPGGLHPWCEIERTLWRGILVDGSGSKQEYRGSEARGVYTGVDLFLSEDGEWTRLTYSGEWSDYAGISSECKTTETILASDGVAAGYNIDSIVRRIAEAVDQAGSRALATTTYLARAGKLRALVDLLAVKP